MAKPADSKRKALHDEVVQALQASQAINFTAVGDAVAKLGPKLLFTDGGSVGDDYIIHAYSSILHIANLSPPPPPPPILQPPPPPPPPDNPPPRV
jgi:hypothetical protein